MGCVCRFERALACVAFAAFLSGLGASTAAGQKPKRNTRTTAARCFEVFVTSPQTRGERRQRRFSATEILDLQIEVRLPTEMDSNERVTVRIFTPDGHLYQELPATAFENESNDTSAAARRQRRRDRSSEPRKRASRDLSAVLPVAGTSIVTSSLYGKWSAFASVDGADICSPPTTFVITP
jgi:hypothetical protein